MKNWFLAFVVAVFITGCSTLQVQVDHDPDFDFSTFTKFSVVYSDKKDGKDFTRARISKTIAKYMQNKGYISSYKQDADFYITMHLDIQKKSQIETNYETMGLRPAIYPYFGVGTHVGVRSMFAYEPDVRVTTSTYEYEEGRLVLEIVDVKKNAVVWQGIAKDELSDDYTAEQKNTYINNVVDKLFKDFPPR